MYGCSDEEIAAIRNGAFESFDPPEAALLRMADAMADTPSTINDEFYAELRRQFSEEQLTPSPLRGAMRGWGTIFPERTKNTNPDPVANCEL